MPRDYAPLYTSIWTNDEDWRTLRPEQQHMYMLLMSQYKVSYCGVLDWIPSRLTGHAKGMTVAYIEAEVENLLARDYLVLDPESSELLIRSFIRWDGLLKMGRPSAAIAKDYRSITSHRIKAAVLVELQRLRDEDPNMAGWASIERQDPDLLAEISGPKRPMRAVS
jgi:hypothetical protein